MIFRATAASPGKAIAKALLIKTAIVAEDARADDAAVELDAFQHAAAVLANRYATDVVALAAKGEKTQADILEIQLTMLQDEAYRDDIRDNILMGYTAAAAVKRTTEKQSAMLESLDDAYFRERAADVRDLGARLTNVLLGDSDAAIVPEGDVIVIASEVAPSLMMSLDPGKVRGIISATGGKTSHAAILAADRGIPAVFGCGDAVMSIPDGALVYLDGFAGVVEHCEDAQSAARRKAEAAAFDTEQRELLLYANKVTETRDGQRVLLFANVTGTSGCEKLQAVGAEGIGLYRTEFLFINRSAPPGEQEQYEAYKRAAIFAGGAPILIRTADIGGDKNVAYLDIAKEENPFLGLRGIRLSLDRREMFNLQLRALLRAAKHGDVRVMLPMVTNIDEVSAAKEALRQAMEDLDRAHLPYCREIKLGVMIETPSAAILADKLAPLVDFFSIGSNDLTQYTIAADRQNAAVSYLFSSLSPAVLRLIQHVCACAKSAGILCGVCGEAAADRMAIPIFLGLGVQELSVAPFLLLPTRRIVSQISIASARQVADKAIQASSVAEVERIVVDAFPDLVRHTQGAPQIGG